MIIKEFKDIFAEFICCSFHTCSNQGIFPDDLKKAEVRPVHK